MSNIIVNQVIPDTLYIFLSVVFSFILYYAKKFYNNHKDILEKQKEALQQTMGIEKYNAVEQLSKE